MKQTSPPLRVTPIASAILLFCVSALHAEIVVGWEMTGQTAWGNQNLPATSPSYHDPDVTIGGLTRGTGFATVNSAVANGWGGHDIEGPLTAEEAITAENFVTFTVTPTATFEFSATSLDLNYRRSGTGPTNFAVQYQVGAGAFADVGTFDLGSSSSAGANLSGLDLASIPALQDVSGQTVTFRIIPFGATDASGTFYFYGPLPGFDLTLNGSVQTIGSSGDTDPPLVASLSPADDSTSTTVDGAETLTMVFNEDISLGSGNILVKNLSGGATVATIDVTNFDQVSLIGNRLDLLLPSLLAAGQSYYVEVPNTAILDTAAVPNAFPGFTGTNAWNFTIAAAGANPTVVVNKYLNGTPDRVELLVVGNGIAGGTLDMRGMLLKDFSSSMGGDNSGRFLFTNASVWAAVPVGTLIVASNTASSPDVNSADYTLSVGLTDTTYFTVASGAGTFDIATTEMVMIKAAGSDPAGTAGGIHVLAGGAAGTFFTNFTGAKLRSTATSGGNLGVIANNGTSTLNDYISGTDATGAVALTLSNFGTPNNGTNAAYIASLRGLILGDGDGVAAVANATPASPFNGLGIFGDGLTAQSAKVTINAQIAGVTLTNITIAVPASLGAPTTATLSGAGATGASVSVVGQTVTITGASATTTNALEVTINGLSTPTPSLVTDNGNYTLTVSTRASGGSLTPIASQPAVRVVIPIASLRDVDGSGISLDSGATVAVEGVATEADFGAGASNYSGFIQDDTGGINIFSGAINPGLVRGNRFVVLGTVTQFNGQTEIVPTAASNIVDLGASSEPTPEVITLAALFSNPEAYEGKLITVQNLTYVSGTWGAAATVVLKDSAPTNIDVRIQAGSTATTPPTYPVNVTGVFGQFDSSSPFTAGYQLLPRDPADLTPGTLSDFDTWALSAGATGGASGDTDLDGQDNAFEYAFGLSPTSGSSVNPFVVPFDKTTGKFSFTRRTPTLTGLAYKVFTSTTLASFTQDAGATLSVTGTVGDVQTVEVTLSPALLSETKLFLRVVAE